MQFLHFRIYLIFFLLLFSAPSYTQENRLDSLKEILTSAKEDSGKVDILNYISSLYFGISPDTCVMYGNEAFALAEHLQYETGMLEATMYLTNSYTSLGNYPMALDVGFKATSLAKKIGKPLDNIIAISNLGICYHFLGDFTTELKYIRTSVKIVEDNFPDSMAFIYTGLSIAYEDLSNHDSAMFYAKKSLSQLKEWKMDNWFSSIYPPLGNAFAGKKLYDSAIFYFQKGITTSIDSKFLTDEIDSYIGIANVYNTIKNPDSTIYYASKVLNHKSGTGYRDGLFKAAALLASVYESKTQPDSALKYLKIAINIKDYLFNRQKSIAIQNLEYQEKQKQANLENSKKAYQDRLKLWALLGTLIILVSIALLQWRNNLQRKKAFTLLQKQERETDHQKQKLEQSLVDLRATQSQLIQSEKMASLGEMTAGIAHEIQNPLNFVNNFAEINLELIEEAGALTVDNTDGNTLMNDIRLNLEKISYHGKRADAIVKSMLQHTKTSAGQKEPSDINALADEYFRISYHNLRRKEDNINIALETIADPTLPSINIIPQDIARVLLNLYNNAFYSVEEKRKQSDHNYVPKVTLQTKNNGNTIQICVKDNGQGIAEKKIDKIFQPFFTTKPTGQGTGLGLSISHDIIKAHNGTITVKSVESEGTEMIVTIPV